MLMERGIDVSYETIRRWTTNFGLRIARNLRWLQGHPDDVWHLDEVVVKGAGRKFWLWRAVDQHGAILDEILQPRRDKRAAKREVAPGIDHWSHKGLNNRAENSHLPFRKREGTMQGYRSPGAEGTCRVPVDPRNYSGIPSVSLCLQLLERPKTSSRI